jgi:hypothetical protein
MGMASKLQFDVVHPQVGVNTQPCIAFRTFVPCSVLFLLDGIHATLHVVTGQNAVVNSVHLPDYNMNSKLYLVLHCGVIKPHHSFIYNEMCLNSLEKVHH